MKHAHNAIAIDPGSLSTGWAIRDDAGFIESGTLKMKGDISARLLSLAVQFSALLKQYPRLTHAVIEVPRELSFKRSSKKRMDELEQARKLFILSRAVGVIQLACAHRGITGRRVTEVYSETWKGMQTKDDSRKRAKIITGRDIVCHDEADAVCILYHHEVTK
jgi:Holliday junction resolvasome RuvABC endonuclease subunit